MTASPSVPVPMNTDHARSNKLVLTYHEICAADSRYAYSINSDAFRKHVALVKSAVTDIGSDIHITFDDGHESSFRLALPILEEDRVKATFFVVAGWVGRRTHCMSWNQVRELAALGHAVQSHTWSHVFLPRCSDAQLQEELASSKKELEDRLGTAVDSISAPGGRWNHRSLEGCAGAGYTRLFVSQPWIYREGRISVSGRLMVRRSMNVAFLQQLALNNRMLLLKMRARAAVSGAMRWVLGDERYLHVWRLLMRKPHDEQYSSERALTGSCMKSQRRAGSDK